MLERVNSMCGVWALKGDSTLQVDFSALEEVEQQLADAEEDAAQQKQNAAISAEAVENAVATREQHLERAATGKALVDVLAHAILQLERLHSLQASVCAFF